MKQNFSEGVSTRVTHEMFYRISSLADMEQRPLSNMVRVLLIEALNNRGVKFEGQKEAPNYNVITEIIGGRNCTRVVEEPKSKMSHGLSEEMIRIMDEAQE